MWTIVAAMTFNDDVVLSQTHKEVEICVESVVHVRGVCAFLLS